MTKLEKEHYSWLKEKYDILVKTIMGSDYYTNSIHVFDADVEAFNDMEKKINRLKYELRMYKGMCFCMVIFTVGIFAIYSITK